MILPRYRIGPSAIPGAGRGLFLLESVTAGRVLIAPDAIDRTWSHAQIESDPALKAQEFAAARWFEDRYTLSPDWPDECCINHSFRPNGLWHLGFVFAATDLDEGVEISIDYRHLLAPGQVEGFNDAATGGTIVGYSWQESLACSTRALAALLR